MSNKIISNKHASILDLTPTRDVYDVNVVLRPHGEPGATREISAETAAGEIIQRVHAAGWVTLTPASVVAVTMPIPVIDLPTLDDVPVLDPEAVTEIPLEEAPPVVETPVSDEVAVVEVLEIVEAPVVEEPVAVEAVVEEPVAVEAVVEEPVAVEVAPTPEPQPAGRKRGR